MTRTVRIGGTMDIPEVLRSLGHDPAKVLAEAGFDSNSSMTPRLWFPSQPEIA